MTKRKRIIKKRIKILRRSLEKLINKKAKYEDVVKKSQELDKYMNVL